MEHQDSNTAEHPGERTFRTLFQEHDAVMLLIEAQSGQIVDANVAAERFYGYSLATLRTMAIQEINALSPDEVAAFRRKADRLEQNGFEFPHRLASGEVRTVEVHSSPIVANGRKLLFSVIHDITKRKQAEEDRRHLESQLQHSQKLESLGVLASGLAHDFNNLLVGIYGNLDFALLEAKSGSSLHAYVANAMTAAERAANLIDQMLAYAGKGKTGIEDVDLKTVTQEMASLLKSSVSKKTTLRLHMPDDLLPMRGDPTQISQIIMNLLTNAAQAIGEEPGDVSLQIEQVTCDRAQLAEMRPDADLPAGTYLRLRVSDTGPGMTQDALKRIFDPFYTTKATGTGLGLSAVHGIVRGHHGAISVDSEPGRGTRFTVVFPAVLQSTIPNTPAPAPADWRGQGTVLVVDDESVVRAHAVDAVRHLGFTALTAEDGIGALDVFREHRAEIVCVLLDLKMPHMDGEETFKELRRLKADLPVILCSGFPHEAATQKFTPEDLGGFVQKPYSLETLKRELHDLLAR
jgi:two-component system, cell cycle sensor histidine kinase and response regulator CckA